MLKLFRVRDIMTFEHLLCITVYLICIIITMIVSIVAAAVNNIIRHLS